MELTPLQIAIIGLVASALTQGIKFASAKLGKDISRFWITVICYAVSVGMAIVFSSQQLNIGGGDPAEWMSSLLAAATAVFGLATLIYNLILRQVFDKLGITGLK